MTREHWIWLWVIGLGAVLLAARALISPEPFGVKYAAPAAAPADAVPAAPAAEGVPAAPATDAARPIDWSGTIGLWIAALLTLFTFSFLYRDNFFYKLAESIVVGVSAAWAMVLGFWSDLVPKLIGRLYPVFVQQHIAPDHKLEQDLWHLVPLVLGLMLLMRLSPKGSWIARWPLAFIIGMTAGYRLIGFLQADFLAQVDRTIMPLAVFENEQFQLWTSLANIALLVSVLACLTYFFFSVEHKGAAGRVARVGVWILMITFGASFAYTVMGRITLLIDRIDFLVDDWLHLV